MVEATLVEEQLKRIKFNAKGWNRAEALELASIILPNEEIFECVNGWYEGGISLICATNIRILLIDKKPFKYLTVEDLRFDMINEIDYSHRMFDARIRISTGLKVMTFSSYNQQRLRKLISHVQHRMAEIKNEQLAQNSRQQEHLQQIDQSLQTYLEAQYQQNESMNGRVKEAETHYAFGPARALEEGELERVRDKLRSTQNKAPVASAAELYEDGRKEVFKSEAIVPTSTNDQVARSLFPTLPHITYLRRLGRTLLRELLVTHPAVEQAAAA